MSERADVPTVPSAPDEPGRLEAIRRWQILEVPPDRFERVAALAARIFEVPYAVVTVVDADRVWFRAHHGLAIDGIDRTPGLCDTVVCTGEPLILADARRDPASLANPLVAGEFGLRFYAGAPLCTSDGHALGTLAVLDQQPRAVTENQQAILSGLAELVVREFELRLAARVQATDDAEQTASERTKANHLDTALSSRGLIGQAMGLVMAQYRCDSEAAFDTLRGISQRRNIKLAGLAHRLVINANNQAHGRVDDLPPGAAPAQRRPGS